MSSGIGGASPGVTAGRGAGALRVIAPAKINLFLHVGETRADGYHALESLIAFTGMSDCVEIRPASGLSLSITGRFAPALPRDDDNLALRAARALQKAGGVEAGAAIALEKNLPVASGIGGGSADAAAVLRGLDQFWGLDHTRKELLALAAELGSDVPVCVLSRTSWVEGRGEILTELPPLPRLSTVLVNPGIALSTAAVFGSLNVRTGLGKAKPAKTLESLWDVIGYLAEAGNDLEAPACQLAPAIQDVLNAFDREPGCAMSAMSGSGGTCFGFFHEYDFARGAAERIAQDHPEWWVSLTQLAGPDIGVPRPA